VETILRPWPAGFGTAETDIAEVGGRIVDDSSTSVKAGFTSPSFHGEAILLYAER
jgi:hypothetical protein